MKVHQSPAILQPVSGGSHRRQIGTLHPHLHPHGSLSLCCQFREGSAFQWDTPPSPCSPHSTLGLLAWLALREHLLLAEGLYLGICLDPDVTKRWGSLAGSALPAPHLRSLLFQTVNQALFRILNSVQTDVGLSLRLNPFARSPFSQNEKV